MVSGGGRTVDGLAGAIQAVVEADDEDLAALCRTAGLDPLQALESSNLSNARLAGEELRDMNLKGSDLSAADLENANLTNANLENANLTNANLENANLTNANLENANLTNANLENANLTNANLNNAKLTDANLAGTEIGGAGFVGANLQGASLEDQTRSTARLDYASLRPAGASGVARAAHLTLRALFALAQRLGDWLLIVCAQGVAAWWHLGSWTSRDSVILAVWILAYAITAEANGTYYPGVNASLKSRLLGPLWAWFLSGYVVFLWLFATKTGELHSRVVIVGAFLMGGVALLAKRSATHGFLRQIRAGGHNVRQAAIIGATPVARRLCKEFDDPSRGIDLVGIYDARNRERSGIDLPEGQEIVGDFEDAVRAAREGKVDVVYIALPLRAEAHISRIVAALADTTATVHLATDFSTLDLLNARWTRLGEVNTASVFDSPSRHGAAFVKRVEDLVLGSLMLLVASPLMVVIAIAIKLSTKGPVFFAQTRYGLSGRPIRVLKFRTLTVVDAPPPVQGDNMRDMRITRVGALLRRYSLDELPQLINVVRGEMSVVGPRPHAVAHNEEYRALIHGYMLRHRVKPGMTGWAQINGWRAETDTVEKMRARVAYDLEYIENWSVGWDFKIILRTFFQGSGRNNAF